MAEGGPPLDDDAMKFGLLMETAQAHQKMAESHLERLRAHTVGLDSVVREEIRRTLIEELMELTVESRRAAQALQGMKRSANMRVLLWSAGLAALCTAIPGVVTRWILPSGNEIAALQSERDLMVLNIKRLEREGGRVEWRHCGEAVRLCVRVDRSAPTYGEGADYFIVKGF